MSAKPEAAGKVDELNPTAAEPADSEVPRRRPRLLGWIALTVGVILVGFVVVLATSKDASTIIVPSPLVGKAVPAVSGPTIDGTQFDLVQYRGRWVLVNFFATWCVPCREENPVLVTFARRHDPIGDAAIVGVVFSDDPAAVRQFRAKQGGDWPMLTDPGGRISIDFGVAKVPESFLVAPSGLVVAKIVGGIGLDPLEQLLAEVKARAQQP